jgi:hypothetical protein
LKRSPLKPGSGFKSQAYARCERKEADAVAKLRKRKCAICREQFEPRSMTHKACKPECAKAVAVADRKRQAARQAKAERAADQEKKLALKPPKWWKAKAKTAFHEFVRAIAEGHPCISCDTILLKLGRPGGDYDAGHFRSVGSAKHLEFDERNVWGQCKHCNDYLKGNQLEYERRLRILKGDAFVDELLADQAPRHYKIADFQKIEATYKAKLKALKASQP